MFYALKTKFQIQDKIYIDADTSITGYVTGIMWAANGIEIRVAYIHNGDSKSHWIEEWRISPAE